MSIFASFAHLIDRYKLSCEVKFSKYILFDLHFIIQSVWIRLVLRHKWVLWDGLVAKEMKFFVIWSMKLHKKKTIARFIICEQLALFE